MITKEFLLGLMPFMSKIVFVSSKITEPYLGFPIYFQNPKNVKEEILTLITKFITLVGINLNVIEGTLDGGYNLGVAISVIYFLVSYLIPTYFFDSLYEMFDFLGVNKNPIIGLIFGITAVLLLDLFVRKIKEYYKKKLEKDGKLF